MKRRTFLSGLLATSALMSISVKSEDTKNVVDSHNNINYEEPFYEFFERFNGFKISKIQKFLYDAYIGNTHYELSVGRQVFGCSTLLLSIAAWESIGDLLTEDYMKPRNCSGVSSTILFVSSNENLNQIRIMDMKYRESKLGMSFPVRFVNVRTPFDPEFKSYSKAFNDCPEYNLNWEKIKRLTRKTFTLRTIEKV